MIPLEILKKAKVGGWTGENIRYNGKLLNENQFSSRGEINCANIALDPDFWMALGKEKKWGYWGGNPKFFDTECPHEMRWQHEAARFYDLIIRKASQEEIDTYWESISKKK